jgi:hypothetical protein
MHKTHDYSMQESNKDSYSTEREYAHHSPQHVNPPFHGQAAKQGNLDPGSAAYTQAIQVITELLLTIENKESEKKQLLSKLVAKEKKWIENDRVFKERRFSLMSALQYGLALAIDRINHLLFLEA